MTRDQIRQWVGLEIVPHNIPATGPVKGFVYYGPPISNALPVVFDRDMVDIWLSGSR